MESGLEEFTSRLKSLESKLDQLSKRLTYMESGLEDEEDSRVVCINDLLKVEKHFTADFLNSIPSKSNYVIENRLGFTGFIGYIVKQSDIFHKSETDMSRHLHVRNRTDKSALILTKQQHDTYRSICDQGQTSSVVIVS